MEKQIVWLTEKPKKKKNKYGLPVLYLCQILTLDATFGYRYSYRVGFITSSNKWNLEESHGLNVVRYRDIDCDESEEQLLQDIKDLNNKGL